MLDLILPLDFHVSHSYYGVTNGVTSLRGQKINYSKFSLLKSHISNGAESPLRHHKKNNGLAKVHSFAGPFCFCTISNWPHHSPQVWGNPSAQRGILRAWRRLRRQRALPMVVPLHPHMRKRLKEQGLWTMASRCTLLDPLGYVDLLSLAGGQPL